GAVHHRAPQLVGRLVVEVVRAAPVLRCRVEPCLRGTALVVGLGQVDLVAAQRLGGAVVATMRDVEVGSGLLGPLVQRVHGLAARVHGDLVQEGDRIEHGARGGVELGDLVGELGRVARQRGAAHEDAPEVAALREPLGSRFSDVAWLPALTSCWLSSRSMASKVCWIACTESKSSTMRFSILPRLMRQAEEKSSTRLARRGWPTASRRLRETSRELWKACSVAFSV